MTRHEFFERVLAAAKTPGLVPADLAQLRNGGTGCLLERGLGATLAQANTPEINGEFFIYNEFRRMFSDGDPGAIYGPSDHFLYKRMSQDEMVEAIEQARKRLTGE